MSILDRFRRRRPPADPRDEAEQSDSAIVPIDAEVVETDLESMTVDELEQHERLLRARIAQRQAELLELSIQEKRYNLHRGAREMLLEKYIQEIEELNRKTPNGIRSVMPGPGDDPQLVEEAFRIWCARRRGGGSRFG
jgi:hypothetical protein